MLKRSAPPRGSYALILPVGWQDRLTQLVATCRLICSSWRIGTLGSLLLLASCAPPEPVNPLSPELRVSAQPSLLLELPADLDFSVVSKQGQGSSGLLIRYNSVGAPHGNYTSYTYDQQRRPVGFCTRTSYDYDELSLVRYQGAYLTYVYSGIDFRMRPVTPQMPDVVGWISKYEYDRQGRLGQILVYEKNDNRFELYGRTEYEYDEAGQLQLTRSTPLYAGSLDRPVYVSYWEQGDVVHELEAYNRRAPLVKPTRRFFYDQVANPRASPDLRPFTNQSAHFFLGSGEQKPDPQTRQYQYEFDGQGRLSGLRYRMLLEGHPGQQWTNWDQRQYVYAP